MWNKIQLFCFDIRIKIKIFFLLLNLNTKVLKHTPYIRKGQKLRSKLMHSTAKIIHLPVRHIVVSATCLEILHTASIIHDDVIDGDSVRRGEKTVNHLMGSRTAVMVGNYLLLQNFYRLFHHYPLNIILRKNLIEGIEKLCSAEIQQGIQYSFRSPPTLKECIKIAEQKTGTLFGLSCKLPFLIGNFTPEDTVFAERCGLAYGTVYQITDDLKDILTDLKFETDQHMHSKREIFFKHWTMPLIFWQKLYPKNFNSTFKNKKITLTDRMLEKITQKCIEEIKNILKDLQQKNKKHLAKVTLYNFILSQIEIFSKKKKIDIQCGNLYL